MPHEISDKKLVELFQAWDKLDAAAQNIQGAPLTEMSEAANKLETARLKMREAMSRLYDVTEAQLSR